MFLDIDDIWLANNLEPKRNIIKKDKNIKLITSPYLRINTNNKNCL